MFGIWPGMFGTWPSLLRSGRAVWRPHSGRPLRQISVISVRILMHNFIYNHDTDCTNNANK